MDDDSLNAFLLRFWKQYVETRAYSGEDAGRVLEAAEAGNVAALILDGAMMAISPTWKMTGGVVDRKMWRASEIRGELVEG